MTARSFQGTPTNISQPLYRTLPFELSPYLLVNLIEGLVGSFQVEQLSILGFAGNHNPLSMQINMNSNFVGDSES